MRPIPCEDWPGVLDDCVARCTQFTSVRVLRETASTQDAAQRMQAQPGDIVTTFRQTAGRGRLGRRWADTGESGVALTLVVEPASPERLAIASAVGAARAAEQWLVESSSTDVSIRWPNDLVIGKRKLAGILVEQDSRAARIGIGMNITQHAFPPELAECACSLAQLGVNIDRLDALDALISCMDATLGDSDAVLIREFAQRDVLRGCCATFEHDRQTIRGRVVDIDPMRGLRVATEAGEAFLPALTTSLLAVE